MAAKRRDQDGFSKAKATGEGFSKSRAAGDDDVEGHSIHRACRRLLEGQGHGEGFAKAKATGDDDVEGHSLHRGASEELPKAKRRREGFSKSRAAGDEDDVEGHAFNRLRSPSSRGE